LTEILDLFISRAREVSIAEAAPRLGLSLKGRADEQAMPCPQCGGKDRFAVNTVKNKWNCRGGGIGGNDAIGLAAHIRGLELTRRPELLEACGLVLGEAVPDEAEQVSDARRAEIRAEADARAAKAASDAAARDREANEFRDKELAKCRGIYEAARMPSLDGPVAQYVRARTGQEAALFDRSVIREAAALTYWHGKDERGHARDLWCGPALVLPFVDGDGQMIGIHQTWVDLANRPKCRPLLTAHGRIAPEALACAGAPDSRRAAVAASAVAGSSTIELLPTKKMRGSKKGGLIPVAGEMSAARWVVGEGFENVAAWYGAELADNEALALATFYAAAGDIGNLAGAAARTGRFAHPHQTKTDARGAVRPVMMPSPLPDPERLGDGFPLAGHVRALLFLGDGDSEPVWTAAQMARAEARARLIAPGIDVGTAWPPAGHDWAELIVRAFRGEAA
jgi:hypothetical protein